MRGANKKTIDTILPYLSDNQPVGDGETSTAGIITLATDLPTAGDTMAAVYLPTARI